MREQLFIDYYKQWVRTYKEGAVRDVTLQKYQMTIKRLEEIAPDLKVGELDKVAYQNILNEYARTHEKQTTMDFHHQLKSAVLDAVDEGLIDRDPTRRAVIKGKPAGHKKIKYLSKFELHTLLADLNLINQVNFDWLILLIAKTGMRFSEALAIMPSDFEFEKATLNISKTWNYKGDGGFTETKNKSSVRKIQIDWQMAMQFATLTKNLPEDKPIFVEEGKAIYNSTINDLLERHCRRCGIPVITVHGLRHTHASLLMADGASIASVSMRLGHSSMTTTQKVYLHVIKELENKDTDIIMRSIAGI